MKLQPLSKSIATRCFHEQHQSEPWQSLLQQQQQESEGTGDPGGTAVLDDPGLLEFSAPDAAGIADDILAGKEPDITKGKKPDGTPPTPPPKPPEQKKDGDPPPPPREEPVAQLRTNYDALKKEHEELKGRLAAGDPRVKALEAERDAAKKDLDDARKQSTEYENRLALSNPAVTKELRDLDDKYVAAASKFYNAVPELDNPTVHQLTLEYSKLPFNTPEYRAAREEFEKKVNKVLGADEGMQHKRLDRALDFIEQTLEFSRERKTMEKRVHENARGLAVEAEKKAYGDRSTHIRSLIDTALKVPEGMDKSDPMHPKVVLANFDKQLKPEQLAKLDENIREFAELVMAGAPPRTEADYAGLSPQQIQERQAAESRRLQASKDHAVDIIVNGMRALRRMPVMMQMLSKYREKAGKLIQDDPPDPGAGDPGAIPDDLKDLALPEIPRGL